MNFTKLEETGLMPRGTEKDTNRQGISNRKNTDEDNAILDLKVCYRALVIKTAWHCHTNGHVICET